MFTGIVIGIGRVISVEDTGEDRRLAIDAAEIESARLKIGDSVSVQGTCVTVTRLERSVFHADLSRETLSRTTLGALGPASRVNLEPSLRAGDALGGHLVSGHIDAVGRVTAAQPDARSWRLEFELPAALMRFVAPKGSICIDGVSLTVNAVEDRRFDVNIIPHTREVTTLGDLAIGIGVNIEIDLVARYLERLMRTTDE